MSLKWFYIIIFTIRKWFYSLFKINRDKKWYVW